MRLLVWPNGNKHIVHKLVNNKHTTCVINRSIHHISQYKHVYTTTSVNNRITSTHSKPLQSTHHRYSHSSARSLGVGSNGGQLVEFNLADIGEGISECELLQWFVKVGDKIEQFDKICEVQSDKANVEITSRYDGIIRELKYDVGQLAKVGAPLCVIETNEQVSDDNNQTTTTNHDNNTTDEQVLDDTEQSGSCSTQPGTTIDPNRKVLTSPAVRHIAKSNNINLQLVPGTGPQGRILKEDVLNYINNKSSTSSATTQSQSQSQSHNYNLPSTQQPTDASRTATMPQLQQSNQQQQATQTSLLSQSSQYLQQDQVHQVSGIQRIMVQTMSAANSVPTFGFSDEIIVDELIKLREQVKPIAEKQGVKLSYLPFIIKACSLALQQYPMLNSHVNHDCTQVTYRSSHNIGLAMDTPRGLLVPNIKDVQNKNILEIASELNRLSQLGSSGKLGKADLTGGTFTLSNIGSLGGTYMKPILVVPEVVIGAMGSFQTLPRYDSNMQLKPTKIMYISWTGDHRVLDGATVARFSTLMKSYIQQPSNMLISTR